ncbi:MAG: aquaporin [Planctomycetes bacterium]|nr:aquaporin [Planctomycetota bacterium]
MEAKQLRIIAIETVGVFGLVLFSAGLVCVSQMTMPEGSTAAAPQTLLQPGLFGIALGQGLIFAALVALTAPITGGYLNPAITLMQWVFNRLETPRAGWLIGAQFAGSVLAAVCLYFIFDLGLLRAAQFGAPHVNAQAYPTGGQSAQFTGALLELLLTFFLVSAIFGLADGDALRLGLVAGMVATVCALFGFPLTGAALNPARWLGPTLFEAYYTTRSAWADTLVYLAGPILGSLLGGFFVFKVYQPASDKK